MDEKVGSEAGRERLVKDEISEKEWVNRKVMTWWLLYRSTAHFSLMLSVYWAWSQAFNLPENNTFCASPPIKCTSLPSFLCHPSYSSLISNLFPSSVPPVVSGVTWTAVSCWTVFLSAAATPPPLAPACSTGWRITAPTTAMTTKQRSSTCTTAAAGRLWPITTWNWWIQLVLVCCQSS